VALFAGMIIFSSLSICGYSIGTVALQCFKWRQCEASSSLTFNILMINNILNAFKFYLAYDENI
jgi:hypothetical protein